MNIKSTSPSQDGYRHRKKARVLRKQLQEEIQQQRQDSAELRKSGDITREEYRSHKEFLNQHDLKRAKTKANRFATGFKTLVGLAAGSVAGYQGGFIGGASGAILGASVSDGITYRTNTGPGLALGSSVLSAVAMGFGGATGGIVGALAGGVGGALAANYGEVPFLLTMIWDN